MYTFLSEMLVSVVLIYDTRTVDIVCSPVLNKMLLGPHSQQRCLLSCMHNVGGICMLAWEYTHALLYGHACMHARMLLGDSKAR